MIIDAHSHLLADFLPSDTPKTRLEEVPEFSLVDFDACCDRLGVGAVVTLAQEMTRVQQRWLGSHDLLAAFRRARPERVIAMAGAEPLDGRDRFNRARLDDVSEALRVKGLRGLLITPPYGHFYCNDPRCYPFYALAQEAGVPLYLHHSAQLGAAIEAPMRYGRPWLLDEVAADFPDLTFLVEHMGWPWTQELFALMAHCPNVWTDISALVCRPHVLAWNLTMARDYGLLGRVVWGTDYVGNLVSEWADVVRNDTEWLRTKLNPLLAKCGWPEMADSELAGILCDNACRLHGVSAPKK